MQQQQRRSRGKGASPARVAALEAIRVIRERDAFAQEVIGHSIDTNKKLSAEDRHFATQLVLGVVSHKGTIDEILNRAMNTPKDVKDNVRDALQISAYEIIFLDKSPYAAVDQGVELARAVTPRVDKLANAILRKVVRLKDEFPFGDPSTDIRAFARLHAFPQWLARRLVADLGPAGAEAFMSASNEPAPLFVCVNPARATDSEVLELLEAAKAEPSSVIVDGVGVLPGCYRLANSRALSDGRIRRLFTQGKICVSDASSQRVALMTLPRHKPVSYLEIGAGRGTKTLLVQGAAQRKWGSQIGCYVTVDNHAFKSKLLAERAEAYGINVSETLTGDARKLSSVVGKRRFDVVFVDAPCSGLGTLRRHHEIRWRLDEASITNIAQTALAMLESAAAHVNPGGTLVFATCTVLKEENLLNVKRFLASDAGADFFLDQESGEPFFYSSQLSSGSPDAHYAVKLTRKA